MEKKQTALEYLLKMANYISTDIRMQIITEDEGDVKYKDTEEHAFKLERQQLEAAFKAGWMRANATNYDPSYFEHFLSETYDNH